MGTITIISLLAAITTITLAFYGLYRRFRKNWVNISHKLDNLENSLHINQRVIIKNDIVVPYKKKVIVLREGTVVDLILVHENSDIITIRAKDGLLLTTTTIDNIMVDDKDSTL